jgi:hypothetical protein
MKKLSNAAEMGDEIFAAPPKIVSAQLLQKIFATPACRQLLY